VHSPGFDHHNKDHPKNKHDPVLEIVTGTSEQHRAVRRLHHDQPGRWAQVRHRAGYHYARRAFAPVIASFCQGADGELQLWICNSSAAPVACDAEVTLAGFSAASDLVATVTAEVAPAQAGLLLRPDSYAFAVRAVLRQLSGPSGRRPC
jgi:beta-mannosidase